MHAQIDCPVDELRCACDIEGLRDSHSCRSVPGGEMSGISSVWWLVDSSRREEFPISHREFDLVLGSGRTANTSKGGSHLPWMSHPWFISLHLSSSSPFAMIWESVTWPISHFRDWTESWLRSALHSSSGKCFLSPIDSFTVSRASIMGTVEDIITLTSTKWLRVEMAVNILDRAFSFTVTLCASWNEIPGEISTTSIGGDVLVHQKNHRGETEVTWEHQASHAQGQFLICQMYAIPIFYCEIGETRTGSEEDGVMSEWRVRRVSDQITLGKYAHVRTHQVNNWDGIQCRIRKNCDEILKISGPK